MNRLFLVRHGETEWNTMKRVQGHTDTTLTEKGVDQARRISNRLYKENIDVIYASDLRRAYRTAEIIGDKLNLGVHSLQELREINFGCWEGLTANEVKEKYREEHLLWMKEAHKLILPGAETLLDVQQRIVKTVLELLKIHNNKNILLVSHGTAIKTLILGILDIDISNYNKISLDNTSLSIIEFRDFNPVIRQLNDTSHLGEV